MTSPEQGSVGHRRLADLLRDEITSGRIPPGQPLPSETTLGQTYGINRQTARAAVRILRSEGLVEAVFGKGILVRQPPELVQVQVPAGTRTRARPAHGDERDRLGLPEGAWVLHVIGPDGEGDLYPADQYEVVSV